MIKNSLKDVEMSGKFNVAGKDLSVLICSACNYWSNWMAYSNWYSVYNSIPEAKIAVTAGRPLNIKTYSCLYNWVYKIADLRFNLHRNVGEQFKIPYLNKLYGVYLALKEGLVKQPLIVLDADMIAVGNLSSSVVTKLNGVGFASSKSVYDIPYEGKAVGSVWYFNNQDLGKIAAVINTIIEMKSQDNHLDLLALSKFYGDEVEIIEDLCGEVQDNDITTFTHYSRGCGKFIKSDWESGKVAPPFNVAHALQSSGMSMNEKKVIAFWSQMSKLWGSLNQVQT